MKQLFRPTLVRRVVLALLIAFVLTWVVLMACTLRLNVNEADEARDVQRLFDFTLKELSFTNDPVVANAYLAGLINGTNRLSYGTREATVSVRLVDKQTQRVVLEMVTWRDGLADRADMLSIKGSTDRWSLLLTRPRHTLMGVLLDAWHDLSVYLLIAFPVILIPTALAVSRGLRPLQNLSNAIAARQPDDLSTLDVEPKYDELKPLVTEMNRLLVQLRVKLEQERAFIQDAAHELRTPLAVIAAQAHALGNMVNDTERQETRQRMEYAIARAAHLMRQLLQLAQADQTPTAAATSVDVAQLIRAELAQVAPQAMTRKIELSLEAPDYCQITCHVAALQSIVHNLLDNAVRYIHEGGHIVVTLNASATELKLRVADDGPGIDPALWDEVFKRFRRGVGHDTPGSGLGLAIVKQAATQLGGRIELDVGLAGRGCTFVLTLPI